MGAWSALFPSGEEQPGPIGGWFVRRMNRTEVIQLVAGVLGIVPLMAMIRSGGS